MRLPDFWEPFFKDDLVVKVWSIKLQFDRVVN
jgi:hypothetical protein